MDLVFVLLLVLSFNVMLRVLKEFIFVALKESSPLNLSL